MFTIVTSECCDDVHMGGGRGAGKIICMGGLLPSQNSWIWGNISVGMRHINRSMNPSILPILAYFLVFVVV